MTDNFDDSECYVDRELIHRTDVLKNHMVTSGSMIQTTDYVLDSGLIALSSQLDHVVVSSPVLDCGATTIVAGMDSRVLNESMFCGVDSSAFTISAKPNYGVSNDFLTVSPNLGAIALSSQLDHVVVNNPILDCGATTIVAGMDSRVSNEPLFCGPDSNAFAVSAKPDYGLSNDFLTVSPNSGAITLNSQIAESSDVMVEEEVSAGLEQRPDELLELRLDSVITVRSREYDSLDVDVGALRERHPKAIRKWKSAVSFYSGGDGEGNLSVIGHLCREAIQEFGEDLYSRDAVHPVADPKVSTRNRMEVSLRRIKSKSVRRFLNDRWKGLDDLVQRLEHSALKEGEAIESEDAILVLFETIVVFCELDSRLPESKAHLN